MLLRSAAALAAALAASSCASPTEARLEPEALAAASVEELPGALRSAGATVVETGESVTSIFSVPGTVLLVNGAHVEAFAFPSEGAAVAEVPRLEQALILWATPMRLYRAGRLLVLAPGTPDSLSRVLERVLGPPVAGVG